MVYWLSETSKFCNENKKACDSLNKKRCPNLVWRRVDKNKKIFSFSCTFEKCKEIFSLSKENSEYQMLFLPERLKLSGKHAQFQILLKSELVLKIVSRCNVLNHSEQLSFLNWIDPQCLSLCFSKRVSLTDLTSVLYAYSNSSTF